MKIHPVDSDWGNRRIVTLAYNSRRFYHLASSYGLSATADEMDI
jgi:hypothetical protein